MAGYVYGNYYLSNSQREYNAQWVYTWCHENWPTMTDTAIFGMLGNLEQESTINPGLWQDKTVGTGGYGAFQWTPASKLFNWTRPRGFQDWNFEGQMLWVRDYTIPYGQWIYTRQYPISFVEWQQREANGLDWDVASSVRCFCYNWEQGGITEMDNKIRYGEKWARYFGGDWEPVTPDPNWPTPTEPPYWTYTDPMPLWFYLKNVNKR